MKYNTPIYQIAENRNHIYIKREDLIPYSFGGNKARKAKLFFEEIDAGNYDYIVTYGSGSSNHCRVVANMACQRGIPCTIISPKEVWKETNNYQLVKLFKAEYLVCSVDEVHQTIEELLKKLRKEGHVPYFIQGGGHGNIGVHAYVECYDEILEYEAVSNMKFDYVFLASGTGTTQAGLICGQYMHKDDRKIVGISIARPRKRGRDIILESIYEYLYSKKAIVDRERIEHQTIFEDDYIQSGYGDTTEAIERCIQQFMIQYGIPLDSTYTAKAFYGMSQYINEKDIVGKNILFIHTGGTPLFFDYLKIMREREAYEY